MQFGQQDLPISRGSAPASENSRMVWIGKSHPVPPPFHNFHCSQVFPSPSRPWIDQPSPPPASHHSFGIQKPNSHHEPSSKIPGLEQNPNPTITASPAPGKQEFFPKKSLRSRGKQQKPLSPPWEFASVFSSCELDPKSLFSHPGCCSSCNSKLGIPESLDPCRDPMFPSWNFPDCPSLTVPNNFPQRRKYFAVSRLSKNSPQFPSQLVEGWNVQLIGPFLPQMISGKQRSHRSTARVG